MEKVLEVFLEVTACLLGKTHVINVPKDVVFAVELVADSMSRR